MISNSTNFDNYNDRTTVRIEVRRILARRAPPPGQVYTYEFLDRQALILEDLLYKLSFTMEDYGDLNTLEARLLEATAMILQSNNFSARSVLESFLVVTP
mmetsp:Transcript_24262/g.49652  ORF Transcript_24262/g.49652 Transcript_24262/m.49652 type:complete len:100 (+) Transcript_24262:71-370(+)